MKRPQSPLALALLFTLLALAILLGTAMFTGPVAFIYRGAAGLAAVRGVEQIAAYLAAAVLFVTGLFLAVPVALQPARLPAKLLKVFPIFALGVALVGVLLTLTGIGSGPFASGWLMAGAVLSAVSILAVAFRSSLSARTLKAAVTGTAAAAVLNLVGWLGMAAALVLILTSSPSTGGGFGGEGQRPPGLGAGGGAGGPGGPGGPGGFGGPGGPAGLAGPGRGAQMLVTFLVIGFVLLTIFAVVMLILNLRARRAVMAAAAGSPVSGPASGSLREAGRAFGALVALVILIFAVIQVVPVPRTNPPVQNAIRWDTPQTADLARRACMDCHSDETV